ncbi:MAG: AIDA repeat-containing protein [Lentisphaeria bacterium]|nr:AIDA repeat-containing protein [Lentisphaeria bacterium]
MCPAVKLAAGSKVYLGSMFVDGTANSTTVNSWGGMYVSNGGTADNTTVNAAGFLFISSGGTANSTTVSPGGYLYVSSGGKATAIDAKSGASLYLTVAPGTYIQGASAGFAFLIENAFISGYTVNSGDLSVYNGGTAYSTTVNSRGYLFVFRGGTANGVTVNAGGYLIVSSGGTATEIVENEGFVEGIPGASIDFVPTAFSNLVLNSGSAAVHSGTTAVSAKVEGYYANMYIYTGGSTVSTTVSSGGTLHIYNGGTASRNTINGVGYLIVSSGGMANENIVNKYGLLYVSSGGTANNATVNWGGSLSVSSGGKITGRLEIASGAVVSAYANAVVDFNIVNQTVSDDYLINDLSRLSGNPNYTITVSSGQDFGRYKLAQGAASFNRTISIGDGTSVYGNLTVNGNMLRYEGRDYALVKNGENLLLDVIEKDDVPPDAPQAFADVTSATNGNVVVTAIFADDSVKNEYSLNNNYWNNYISGYRFTSNGTIYFRSTDKAGNISEVTTYTVSNIDTTPPARPTVSVSTDQWTNENVIVTAIFSDDSARNEYSINGGGWNDYSGPLEMEVNGSVSFRSADAAGNISQTANYNVANIDKTLPTLSISGNAENWTNQNVVLTASATDDDSGVRSLEYSFDHENWTVGSSVSVEQNGTVYFRATDNAGNIREDSVFVDKIDKAGPEISFVGFSGNWINDTTTVTAVAEDGLSGVQSIEYSFDDSTWISGASVTVSEASIIYFRALDNVGNVSTKNLAIQIDQVRPTLSISGNAVNWTNRNVVLTASAADDASGVSAVEYSFDHENWTVGSSVSVEQNGTVYFRAVDNAGNTTEDSVAVTKINKTAPVFQNIALSSEDWTFDPVTATPQVTDDIDFTLTYRIGNGSLQTWSGETIQIISPAYVYFTATDAAGNFSSASVYAKAGYVPVSSGSTFSGLSVSRGVLDVLSGGAAKEFSVSSGGSVRNSGIVSGLHASAGAIITGGGRFYLTSDTVIASGVMDQTQDQRLSGTSAFSKFIAASAWHVAQKLHLKEAEVTSGGSLTFHGGASATILNNSGYVEVLSKGNVRSVTVYSGAELMVNGGHAAAVTIRQGGMETLTNGGSGLRTSVYGSLLVVSGGTANSTTVYSGGTQTVGIHGLTKSGIVREGVQLVYGGSSYRDQLAGGSQIISDGGTVTETTGSGFQQTILADGYAVSTEITGGSQFLEGYAASTVINSGLQQISGGRAENTVINNGTQQIYSGGYAENTVINIGVQEIEASALASDTRLYGANQTVSSGGSAIDTVVGAGAYQHVLKDGSVRNTEVGSGGSYTIEYDGYGENATILTGGTIHVNGTVRNLTVDRNSYYHFNLETAVFQGNLDCYLKPTELDILNEILMFSELDSLTLLVNASSFGQDQYDVFSTESNPDLEYRFMLVLDEGKAISLRDGSRYWYDGESYSLEYGVNSSQYYLIKTSQGRTRVLLSADSNIDILETESSKVTWSANSYQDYGEVIAVQETGAGKTVYLNTGILVNGVLQNAAAVDFTAGGTLQFGTKTFTVDMYSHDDAESIVYGVRNASVIHRRLASEQALPDNVTMNISAAAVDGSACAAAFVNDSGDLVFSGGIAGAMNVNAVGNAADARGIFAAGSTTITEPVTGAALIHANASGANAYALGASLLDGDDLDMNWDINADSDETDALAVGIAARNLGQWTADGKLQVTANAGKNAAAYGFAASDHRGGAVVSKFLVSEVFSGSLQVAATGNNAEAVGVESNLELGCNMASEIDVTATGTRNADALGLNALSQGSVSGKIRVQATGVNQAKAVGTHILENSSLGGVFAVSAEATDGEDVRAVGVEQLASSDLAGVFAVSAKSSVRDAWATGWLGNAGTVSSDITIYAEGSNSVRAFAFVDDFDSASGGSLNTLAENGTINVTARSINVDNPSMAPVYAIGGRIDGTAAGSICVSAVSSNPEQETRAKAVHASTISVSGIIGASAATQSVAVAANSEITQLTMTVSGVVFAGDAAMNGDNAALLTLLKSPWGNLATLSQAKDRATHQAYAVYAYDKNDAVTMVQNAVVIGDMEFAGGSNSLTISNGAYYYGDLNAENGSLTVNFTLDSMRTDRAVITGNIGPDTALSADISQIKSNGRYVLISGSVPAATASAMTVKYFGGSTVLTENDADYTTINNYGKYRYYRDGGDLIFEADGLVQANITVTSNISNQTITNQDVILTAEFSSTADITARQYKINNGSWMDYTGSVDVNENSTVTFRLIDNEMNEVVEQYVVTNIDKTAPVISSITPGIITETAGPVVVTAEFSDDRELAARQYRIGEGAWQDYINGVAVSQNATVYFRAADTAGNETTDYIVIGNIKTTLPVITLNGNNVSLAESALLTASSDSGNPIYYNTVSSDYNGIWSVYSSPITVTDNATYYFRTTDSVGNIGTASITFSNIDQVAPPELSTEFFTGNFAGTGTSLHDVVLYKANEGGRVTVLTDTVTGFAPVELAAAGEPWKLIGVGDFNGDGVSDVLWRNMSIGDVGSWLGNGQFGVTWQHMAGASVGEWEIVGVGDFNADATDDVLWYNTQTGLMLNWQVQNGVYSADAIIAGAAPGEWRFAGVGDFNGDGTDDILWHNQISGAGGYWALQNGTYSAWRDLAGANPEEWTMIGIGDFDANGYDDVLWLNNDTGLVGCWANNSTGNVEWNTLAGAGDLQGWHYSGVGDFDNDGRSDVLWAHDSGAIGSWITATDRIAVGSWMPIA